MPLHTEAAEAGPGPAAPPTVPLSAKHILTRVTVGACWEAGADRLLRCRGSQIKALTKDNIERYRDCIVSL